MGLTRIWKAEAGKKTYVPETEQKSPKRTNDKFKYLSGKLWSEIQR